MDAFVSSKVWRIGKSLATNLAAKRPHPRMNTLVLLPLRRIGEGFLAITTHKRPLTSVNTLVTSQVGRLAERLLAKATTVLALGLTGIRPIECSQLGRKRQVSIAKSTRKCLKVCAWRHLISVERSSGHSAVIGKKRRTSTEKTLLLLWGERIEFSFLHSLRVCLALIETFFVIVGHISVLYEFSWRLSNWQKIGDLKLKKRERQ